MDITVRDGGVASAAQMVLERDKAVILVNYSMAISATKSSDPMADHAAKNSCAGIPHPDHIVLRRIHRFLRSSRDAFPIKIKRACRKTVSLFMSRKRHYSLSGKIFYNLKPKKILH